jgi:hypothetical protein
MKTPLLLAALCAMLAGCGVADFAAQQNQWNQAHGMGSMNPGGGMDGGPSAEERAAAERDAETQRNIRQGEALENEEASKAGLGPSPTAGMNCTSSSSFTGSANSGTSTSVTHCHN